ncbi:thioredoxin-disulfide reductase [Parablautia sp. Marseille-Q6255]|uniref:thioredoxin-disulfide reductase n=1 Tax=Parablautia sp. Marseille-Q6255 TaxID=3039593 RepID=UPI0024BD1EF3|nr:thioredoxin-disulfide reductase [Parablautia sp. Marseille-Q6255]
MIYDVIIIGSGPAGLAAAIYAQRAKLTTVVLEKEYMSGGQVVNTYEVDNYPGLPGIGGFELGMKFREHAEKLGAQFINIEVKHIGLEDEGRVKVVYTDSEEFRARTLILAMGARHRELGIPGEKELAGMGVSYCATCDGAFFKGRTVAVVGGGDVAVEDALFLARGCEKVYLIHRRDELRAAAVLQEQLKKCENVSFVWDSEVVEISGEDHVECIKIRNKKSGEEKVQDVDGVFIAVGTIPNTGNITELLHLDKNGYIPASEDGKTEIPGIFAAGDIRTKQLRQIVTAVSDGANAITSVQAYINAL